MSKLLVIAVVSAALALATSGAALAGPEGTWSSDYGQMVIFDTPKEGVIATYDGDGQIYGSLENNRLSGQWAQPSAHQACGVERGGSIFWGDVILQFNEDFSAFSGSWNRCGGETVAGWSGTRIHHVGAPKIQLVLDYSNDFHADLPAGTPGRRYPDDLSESILYIEIENGEFAEIGTLSDDTPYKAVQIDESSPLWRDDVGSPLWRVDESLEFQSPNEAATKGWTTHRFDLSDYVKATGTYHFRWQWVAGRDTGHVRDFHIEVNGTRWFDRDRGSEEGNANDGAGDALDGGDYVDHYVYLEVPSAGQAPESARFDQDIAIRSIEIVNADTRDPIQEIAIGESFRVRLTYAEDPGREVTESVTVRTTSGISKLLQVTGDSQVIVSEPVLVVPAVEP